MITIETTEYGNGETLVVLKRGTREVGSLIVAERRSGGVGIEVWQYADDAHPLQTVEIPKS